MATTKRFRRQAYFTTIKDLQTHRLPHERVQFSLGLSGDPTKPAPPSGFIVFEYPKGNRQTLEPFVIRLTHSFCGEWEAKPLFLHSILTYHEGRIGKKGCKAKLSNIFNLVSFIRQGQKDGVETMETLPPLMKNSKVQARPKDLPDHLLDFCKTLAEDESMPNLSTIPRGDIDIRITMPDVPFGGFVAWQGPHGNASPYAPSKERIGSYAELYILDTVRSDRLREHPEAAEDFAKKTRGWLEGAAPFAAHGGSNHKTGPHLEWLKATAPEGKDAPDLPEMTEEEADFFYTGQPLIPYTGQGDAILPPEVLERVQTHGFAVISPKDLIGIDTDAWLKAVADARDECRAHFAWVVYTRRGVEIPDDIYLPLWGRAKAEEVAPGHPFLMNEGEVSKSIGNSLCSGFAGLGAATANSRGPAVVHMQVCQGIVRGVATALNGPCYLAPDRYRVKRYDGPENIFTLHWDVIA